MTEQFSSPAEGRKKIIEFLDLAEHIADRYGMSDDEYIAVRTALGHLDLFVEQVPQPDLSRISRVCIVNEDGRVFDRNRLYDNGVWLDIQDEGRTLKVFNRGRGE